MKVWIGFMVLAFAFGGRALRRGQRSRMWTMLLGSVVVTFAMYSQRFV
jgi:hypothetical protein